MITNKNKYNPWMGDVPLEAVYGFAEIGRPWSEIEDTGVLDY
jgi:hypothetical protein